LQEKNLEVDKLPNEEEKEKLYQECLSLMFKEREEFKKQNQFNNNESKTYLDILGEEANKFCNE
jgi:hypothetical protein